MSFASRILCHRSTNAFKVFRYDYQASRSSLLFISNRCYVRLPEIYVADNDPAPYFFSENVQNLMKHLTRPDYDKVFRKRTNKGDEKLKRPKYKFMTSEELEDAMKQASIKANTLLQMPPVLKVRSPIDEVISKDPGITSHDEARFIFTDITYGISNKDRLITVRETDGTLKYADHDVREKMNQIYFPTFGRRLRPPAMFTDQSLLDDLLERQEYEFILDKACLEFEPDDEFYQRISSQVYQHCDSNKKFDLLRSTRHFGPMCFYLAWNNSIDNLLLDLLHTQMAQESVCLINLYKTLHPNEIKMETPDSLCEKILANKEVPIIKKEKESFDAEFEEKCLDCIDEYINKFSAMKSSQELAVQSLREMVKHKAELQKGLQVAHGQV